MQRFGWIWMMCAGLAVGGAAARVHGATAAPEGLQEWLAVADADLAARRGGFRVGAFDIEIGLTVRDYLNGEPVLTSQFWLSDALRGVAWLRLGGSPADVVEASGARFSHELTPSGVRLLVENVANGAVLQRDATLDVFVHGFERAMGDASLRAARSVAARQASSWLVR